MPQEQCYHYQEDLDQLRNITMGSAEYEEMFSELSKLVSDEYIDHNHRGGKKQHSVLDYGGLEWVQGDVLWAY